MISKFFIERPVLACVLSIVIVLTGLISMSNLPVEQYPNILPSQVVVETSYTGASAETISNTVASILESSINGVEDMIYMQTMTSSSGDLTITVTFGVGVNTDTAVMNVNNRVQAVLSRLPEDVQRTGVTVKKGATIQTMFLNMYSENSAHDRLFLANYATINILDELKRISGVAEAAVFVPLEYAMRIWLKPDKMQHYSITPNEVIEIIRQQNAQNPSGSFGKEPISETSKYSYTIITDGMFKSASEFENIILKSNDDGSTLRLKDIADVTLGADSYSFTSRFQNIDAVPLRITLQLGANAINVNKEIDRVLEDLKTKFPEGIKLVKLYDMTDFINVSISETVKTFFEAVILVVVVMFLFLQNFRATIIPVIAIPVSIIGSFTGMYLLGFSINQFTLFGLILAIGIVVDDAIVVIENIERIMAEKKLSAKEAAIISMQEITSPVIAIVLVLSAVFIPVAFMGGLTGVIYKQFAVTIVISVVISGFVALTLTPVLCALFLKESHKEPNKFFRKFNMIFEKLSSKYSNGASYVIKHGFLHTVIFIIMIIAIVMIFKNTSTGFVPNEDTGLINVFIETPAGSNLSVTDKAGDYMLEASSEINGIAGEATVISGYNFIAGAPQSNHGVSFMPLKSWNKRTDKEQHINSIMAELSGKLSNNPNATYLLAPMPTIIGLDDSGGLTIYVQSRGGGSLDELAEYSRKITDELMKRDEIVNAYSSLNMNTPQYRIKVDREKAAALNVRIDEVYTAMQSFLGSYYVNDFEYNNRVYKVNIQAESRFRESPDYINEIFVKSETGALIPIGTIISFEKITGADILERFNLFPSSKIISYPSSNYSSGDAIKVIEEVASTILPEGYTIAYYGTTYQEKAASSTGQKVFIFGLVFVYLILAAQYGKWILPIGVLTAVPFAVFGAVLAVFLREMYNDIYFQIGLLTLIALSAKNAVLIIEYAVSLNKNNGLTITQSAVQAAKLRFRPIIMTSLAFTAGVIPLAVSSGPGAFGRQSLGTGVVGGMLGATIIAIFFIPLFYTYFARLENYLLKKYKKNE